jgi:hypothetical protein
MESALRNLLKDFRREVSVGNTAKPVGNSTALPNKVEMLAGIVPREAIVSPLKR